jgi:hypothetical protein
MEVGELVVWYKMGHHLLMGSSAQMVLMMNCLSLEGPVRSSPVPKGILMMILSECATYIHQSIM